VYNKSRFTLSHGELATHELISDFEKVVIENVKSGIELSLLEERSEVYTAQLDKLPVIERKVTDLERNVKVLQQVGVELRSMLEQVKLTEAAVTGNVTVIDVARVPTIPVSPNKMLIMAIAALLGMALGFLMCILVNLRDNVISTREDIRKTLGDTIPILGCLTLLKNPKEQKNNNYSDVQESDKPNHSSIFVYENPNSLHSEQLLSITSNLLYGKAFNKNQVISISSCDMSAGKTTIISNIAMSLVQTGAKVILIDGDLRLPSLASVFGYSRNKIGLSDVVLEKEKLEDVIVQPIADIPNLHLLPVGLRPQVPSSILSFNHIEPIINILKANYDYILIDAPPVSYSLEVLTIGQLSDAIVINVRAGITTKEALKELMKTLDTVKDKISGIVLNGFIPITSDPGGHTSDYGYGKYTYGKYGYNKYS
jgi:capsular exopolysaccharide synthesis family protein